jgi:hypothetical protein
VVNFPKNRDRRTDPWLLFQYFQFFDGVWVIESLYFEVSKLVWTLFTVVMTVAGLKSSFFCMVWVLFPMAGRFILDRIYDRNAVQRKRKGRKTYFGRLGFV